jgi:cytochrome bd-type quinol oxidase subunit 2
VRRYENPGRRLKTLLLIGEVGLVTGLAMLPFYAIILFVIDDQNTEYLKASAGYDPVPATVEGGSPFFIYLSMIPMALVLAVGLIAAIVLARRKQASWRFILISAGVVGVLLIAIYLAWNTTVGPTWPPPVG